MKKGNKYQIRQVSITNMTNFLNLLAGKTFRSKEIVELSKEHHIRANFLSYAKAISYCKKQADGSYYFLDRLFDPIHGKLLIETSNKYNNEVMEKKRNMLKLMTNDLKAEEKNNDLEIENAPAKRERGRPAKLVTIDETEQVVEKQIIENPLESVSGIWGNIFISKEHKLAKDKIVELTHKNNCYLDEIETMSACIKGLQKNKSNENSKELIEDLKQEIIELDQENNDLIVQIEELKNNKENEYRTNLIQQYEGDIDFLEKEKKELQEENNSLKENIKHLKYLIYNAKEVDKSHEKNNEKTLLIKELLLEYLSDDCELNREQNNKKQIENKTNFNPFEAPVIERAYTKEFYIDEE